METDLEHILTHAHKPAITSYLDAHPNELKEAVQLAVSDKQPYAWRAGWFLWSYLKLNDPRIKGQLQKILDVIAIRPADQQRELLKILLLMDLEEKQEVPLLDLCVRIWREIRQKPSVRLTAFKMMVKIAKKSPELSYEVLRLSQNPYLEALSPTARRAIARLVQELKIQ